MADLPPELAPTPMPGAKKSSDAANKPYVGETTGNNSNTTSEVYHPEQAMPLSEHLRNLLGTKSAGGPPKGETVNPTTGKTIMQTVDEAVASAPSVPEHGE